MNSIFNFSRKKVGGIWFVKLGRFTLSFSLSRAYRPIGEQAWPVPPSLVEADRLLQTMGVYNDQ